MEIRLLQAADESALLAFELANRAWFERFIEARHPDVYSPSGIAVHIADALDACAKGTLLPFVIADHAGAIVGRANLKDIDTVRGTAEAGYRVAEAAAGKGLASAALAHLVEQARGKKLRTLQAIVSFDNPASAKVLIKRGFVGGEMLPRYAQVGGQLLDCRRFVLQLNNDQLPQP